jgi:hypothetical protein
MEDFRTLAVILMFLFLLQDAPLLSQNKRVAQRSLKEIQSTSWNEILNIKLYISMKAHIICISEPELVVQRFSIINLVIDF